MATYDPKWVRPVLLLLLIWGPPILQAQDVFRYIVLFTDKAGTPYSLSEPREFLSVDALARRSAQSILPDTTDLPVTPDYLNFLDSLGFSVLGESRWLNAALVETGSETDTEVLTALPMVRKALRAATYRPGGRVESEQTVALTPALAWQVRQDADYGSSYGQIAQLNGAFLHRNGWTGEGVRIAVLDAGFLRVDELSAFEALRMSGRIRAAYDFVDFDDSPYDVSGHGTGVLSTMAGHIDGQFMGTAPDADYILIRTEDVASEQLVEEFNYVLGLEFADQAGVDVVNTSLGYTLFQETEMNHEAEDLNGDVALASIGADMAASKGIIVLNSAGNAGAQAWRYISVPADADSVLAVGSVNASGRRSDFSGEGYPPSGQIKPDVMALGEHAAIIQTNGEVGFSNGTSFSSPILCGLVACLRQAFPDRPSMEIVRAVQQSGSMSLSPDYLSGYGIPDMQAAYALLYREAQEWDPGDQIAIFPNPFHSELTLLMPEGFPPGFDVDLINDVGQTFFTRRVDGGQGETLRLRLDGVENLSTGLYFLKIRTSGRVLVFKLMKV